MKQFVEGYLIHTLFRATTSCTPQYKDLLGDFWGQGPVEKRMSDFDVNLSLLDFRTFDLSNVMRDGKEFRERFSVCDRFNLCLLYTSPSPRDGLLSRMPSSA